MVSDNTNQGEPLSFFPKGSNGPCPHTGGDDVIAMVEKQLHEKNIEESQWDGYGAVFVENLPNYMWKSIKTVIARESGKWIIKEIDRRKNLSENEELGFQLITP
jgi:hypothetical protein